MAGKLKPLEVARQVTPGKYPDGDGLYLIVAGPTSRNWSYRYWIKGKERWHGLGSSQDLSLKDARIKRDAARQEVGAGVDVVQTKRLAREGAGAEAAVAAATTFKERTERYIKDNEAKWSKKHAAQWPSSLKQYACRATFSSCSSRFGSRSARPSNRVRGRIETIIAKNVDIDDNGFLPN